MKMGGMSSLDCFKYSCSPEQNKFWMRVEVYKMGKASFLKNKNPKAGLQWGFESIVF